MPRPRRSVELTARELAKAGDLGLAHEVAWYLKSRGIPFPTCPPAIATPSPGEAKGARFDDERVDRVLSAFRLLRHTQGEWAGRPLNPDPWQVAYIIAPVFGWVRPSGEGWARVVRKLYVDVPRKNGKTTTAGGLAIYLTCADDEPGAQVIAAAAGERQARYCFDPIKAIAEKSPALGPHVKALAKRVVHKRTGSYFEVVANTADLLHGANVHGAIVDELHVHKTGDLLEAIETGTGSRRQPLVAIITTADDGRQATPYAIRRQLIEELASGTVTDPSMYGVVWAAAEDDDPMAEATWKRANPGYGVSPTREFMANAATQAATSPAALASFLRLHLGIRTRQQTKHLELAAWDRNRGGFLEADLAGKSCYGGLDLASTADLTAFAMCFPDGEGGYRLLWRHWLPEEALPAFDKRTAGMGTVWAREGWLKLTPGNVLDYGHVRSQINADRARFVVREIGYDPWNATQLVTDLTGDGAEMVPVRQGFVTMSAPTKELQRLTLEGTAERPRFEHAGNPLVRWQVDNLGVETDAAGNVKPSKKASGEKIDGLVASIIALDRASRHAPARRSAYEDRGVTVA